MIGSIGGLQQAVGLDSVARAVGVKRFSKGSFSESPRVFDPELLRPIIAEFADELSGQVDPRLKDLDHVLTLVDGTVLRGLVALAKAAWEVRPDLPILLADEGDAGVALGRRESQRGGISREKPGSVQRNLARDGSLLMHQNVRSTSESSRNYSRNGSN